jgi:cytochrome P450 PksS
MNVQTDQRPQPGAAVDFGLELSRPDVREDPYPLFARMRREDPVHYSRVLRAWVVTRYADVLQALRDVRLSGDRAGFLMEQLGAGDRDVVKDFERVERGMMINKDGPEHLRLRRLAQHGFTPGRLAAARPRIQKVVDGLLRPAHASGRLDVVTEFAEPLPTLVICELMGIPAEDGPLLRRWSEAKGRFRGLGLADLVAAGAANVAAVNLERYFLRLVEERRRRPGDDLLSVLAAGHEEGRLSDAELVAQCQLLFSAGHQTLIDQLANAVHALLCHPGQLRSLLADPALVGPAVEEALRYDPPVLFVPRVAAADVEVGGRRVWAGEVVLLGLGAANRDPEVFAAPDRFDVGRAARTHLAFASGAHACLGMGLARLELEVAVGTLFARYPYLRLDPANLARRRCETLTFRGFHVLPTRTA